jgi:spoIIIJ-associated protein
MESTEMSNKLEGLVAELMDLLNIKATIQVDETESEGKKYLDVKLEIADNAAELIGYHGSRLDAIAALLNLMVPSDGETRYTVIVDVNGYREERAEHIREITRRTLEDVIASGEEVEMDPMKPWERRVVHMELAERTDVRTRSDGEGEDRRVVIEPISVI